MSKTFGIPLWQKGQLYLRTIPKVLLICFLSFATGAESHAQNSELELKVAFRVISFIDSVPNTLPLGIIYDPNNPDSQAEAERIRAFIASNGAAAKKKLSPELIPLGQGGNWQNIPVAILASQLKADTFPGLATAAIKGGTVLISTNAECVSQGHCAVFITTSPKVEIHISQAAVDAIGAQFNSSFLMLVKKK